MHTARHAVRRDQPEWQRSRTRTTLCVANATMMMRPEEDRMGPPALPGPGSAPWQRALIEILESLRAKSGGSTA